jgi:hypothetical protein
LTLHAPTYAQEHRPAASEATLPLEEILRLYRETEQAKQKPEVGPPPVRATVHQLDMSGRLLDGAVDLTARFEVVVLDDGQWVSVPLLEQDAHTHLSTLPPIKDGYFTVGDGYLQFMTRRKGTYAIEISFLKQAERSERRRRVQITFDRATLAVCRISFDEGLFRLHDIETIERSEGVVLFPEANVFTIEWERRTAAMEAKQKAAPRPAIESVIRVAHASAVSTLEGRRVIRLRYDLRFAGTKSIEVALPEGLVMERAYLNGVSIPVAVTGTTLPIEVAPVREGDQSGLLELVLLSSEGGYFLSGALEVALPKVSWPVNELFLDLHLPQVFNYEWSGGSLSPVAEAPAVDFTYELPLPGKKLSFHQHLIAASAPNVTLDYAVDLEGHYYRP